MPVRPIDKWMPNVIREMLASRLISLDEKLREKYKLWDSLTTKITGYININIKSNIIEQ